MNHLNNIFFNKKTISLDKFINNSLFKKNLGYYEKEEIFGKRGDFVTSPIISSIFSEIICIWIVSYWIFIKKPKIINILELGPGNGLLIKDIIITLQKIKTFNSKTNFYLFEKSKNLIKKQEKNLSKFKKIKWINKIDKLTNYPTIIISNEFFDTLPIKQYYKKKNLWFEKHIVFEKKNKKIKYFYKPIKSLNIKKYSKFYDLTKSTVFEYSTVIEKYINTISKIIKKNKNIFIMFDYGYVGNIGKETLRGFKNHRLVNFLKYYLNCDITADVNFDIIKKIFSNNNLNYSKMQSQNYFLQKLGILERAKQVLKINEANSKKIIASLNRLLNPNEMGERFKVFMTSNKNCKFNLGFE